MATRVPRRIAIAAIAGGMIVVAGLTLYERRGAEGAREAGMAAYPRRVSTFAPEPRVPSDSTSATAKGAVSPPVLGAGSAPPPAQQVESVPRLRLQVHAPPEVRVGEMFEARVDVDAGGAMRALRFALAYDKSRLALVEWTAGDFVRQSGVAPDVLKADEPSDGNVELSLDAGDGHWVTGAGSIALLRFEARRVGTSVIALRDVTATDASGIATQSATVLRDGSITVR